MSGLITGADGRAMDSDGLYDALAPLYDAWQSADGTIPFARLAHAKLEPLLARWLPTAAEAGPRSFVDLGCGTGELLLALGRSHPGWRLCGVDGSAAMLAEAARKPGGARVTWTRARIDRPLPLAGPFDAAGAFYDTFNHMPDAATLERALAAAAGVLRPGGLLIFDVTNAYGFERWWRGRNRWAGAGWSIAIETGYDAPAGIGHARVEITRGDLRRSFALAERLFSDAEIETALGDAGLAVEKTDLWSPFAIDAYGKTLWTTRKLTRS